MLPNKLRLDNAHTSRLRSVKARTGLTPNIVCRIGFCLSLADKNIPDPSQYQEDGVEFNRYTLLGDQETLYVALLKQRLSKDGLDLDGDLVEQLRAHMNRGADMATRRVKNLPAMIELLPRKRKISE
jgi:DNA sulfur modification protein DndE